MFAVWWGMLIERDSYTDHKKSLCSLKNYHFSHPPPYSPAPTAEPVPEPVNVRYFDQRPPQRDWDIDYSETVECSEVGLCTVIGKDGDTIRSIGDESGARVNIERNPPIVRLRGTKDQVKKARELVETVLAKEDPSLPEPEPVIARYQVQRKSLVLSGPAPHSSESPKAGVLARGEVIDVFEIRTVAKGKQYLRFDRGWVCLSRFMDDRWDFALIPLPD